jgi:hypothetical protein
VYQVLFEELKQTLAARQALIEEIERAQNEISGARQSSRDSMMSRINQFKTADMAVEISFESGNDRGAAIEFMREKGFLSQQTFGQYKNRRVSERCCAMAKPTVIARAILEKKAEVLLEEGRQFEADGNLTAEEGKKLVEGFHPFSEDIDAGKLSQVLMLQEQRWDDALRILLNGRPVDQLSPGQRSSAMLPLVAFLKRCHSLSTSQKITSITEWLVARLRKFSLN